MCGRYFIDMDPDDDELEEIMQDLNRRGLLRRTDTSGSSGVADAVASATGSGVSDHRAGPSSEDGHPQVCGTSGAPGTAKGNAGIPPLKTCGEIFPTDIVPVVANGREGGSARTGGFVRPGRPRAFAMRWGYTLNGSRRVINARSETAAERPMFLDGMRTRRLLIPASGYYEWLRHDKKGQKYAIRPDAGGSFYMAGIYRFEVGTPVFTILTREPDPSIAFIHDRMPVILPHEAAGDWLNLRYDARDVLRAAARGPLHMTAAAV